MGRNSRMRGEEGREWGKRGVTREREEEGRKWEEVGKGKERGRISLVPQ
jgi:hypothetical protein